MSEVDLESLDTDKADRYWRAITVIEAQSVLVQLKVASYPYMSKDDQGSLFREIHAQAYPNQKKERVSLEEFANRLRSAMNA